MTHFKIVEYKFEMVESTGNMTQKILEEIRYTPIDLSTIEVKHGHLVPKTDYELVISQIINTLKDINGAPW